MKNIILQNLLRCCFILLLAGCSSRGTEPAAYYSGSQPMQYSRPPTPVKTTPDYYYSQPYSQPQQQQYQPQPQPQQYRQPSQPYQQQGGSRAYVNPYAFQPSPQYPYYDSDQYYVPPTYYGAPEIVNSPSSRQ